VGNGQGHNALGVLLTERRGVLRHQQLHQPADRVNGD
jgi:hypothetical protein